MLVLDPRDLGSVATHPNDRLHVLYVVWGFVPHRGPGAYRPLATVNELARRGHRVTVLTADLDTFAIAIGGDETLLEQVDPSVKVLRVPMTQDLRDPLINRWSHERAHDQRRWAQRVADDQVKAFPEVVYAPWGPRARAVAVALHERDAIDLVIATGNPYVDFSVPFALHSDYGVPFVLDDRDSWLLDVYTGEPAQTAEAVRPWFEFALDAALEMWFVNPPIADWHRREYPQHGDKIKVVENGWDPTFLRPDELEHRGICDSLVFSFVGTINSRLPLDLLGSSWREARRISPLLAASEFRMIGHFGYAGEMTSEQRRIKAEYASDGLLFTGRQPKDQIGEAYAHSDVLVFAKEGSGLVTSGKIYEYVASGRPIVSVVDQHHDARRVLQGYPRWHDAKREDVASLAAAMISAAEDAVAKPELLPPAQAHGARYRRDAVLALAIDSIERRLSS